MNLLYSYIVISVVTSFVAFAVFSYRLRRIGNHDLGRRNLMVLAPISRKVYYVNVISSIFLIQVFLWLYMTISLSPFGQWVDGSVWSFIGINVPGGFLFGMAFTLLFLFTANLFGMVVTKTRCGIYFWQRHIARTKNQDEGGRGAEKGSGVID